MNRRKGFSLVELLIVLAVMAALIATITPVALNAIKKAKATQVAQNIKTMAGSLENAAYVNGIKTSVSPNVIFGTGTNEITLANLGRDIDEAKYDVYYSVNNGTVDATIMSIAEGDIATIQTIIQDAAQETYAATMVGATDEKLGSLDFSGKTVTYYTIQFEVY